jgi:hypothetical protein
MMAPSNREVIDLLSSDDEETKSPNLVKRRANSLDAKKNATREKMAEILFALIFPTVTTMT